MSALCQKRTKCIATKGIASRSPHRPKKAATLGSLRALGLRRDDIPIALLMFNVGVEIGQLAFVALILTNNERPLRERQQARLWLTSRAATL